MNGAQYILAFLEQQRCSRVFGYPGGAIMPLYDALLDSSIKHYLSRHEQAAAFAAIGQARAANQTAVCFGTSGPGATNLLTAVADARLDSVPLLIITGQVPTPAMGSDAFQEVDVLGLSLSITKHSFLVDKIEDLPETLEKAWQLTHSGRPGPVLVDVPKDIFLSTVGSKFSAKHSSLTNILESSGENINSYNKPLNNNTLENIAIANQLLRSSTKPVLYVGGGVAMANALDELKCYIEKTQIPAVATLKGLGSIDKTYPLNLGMLGMHGLPPANHAVQESDLLIVVGARLDDRATGKLSEFAPSAKVIHVDIDAAELSKRRFADAGIKANVKQVFPRLYTDIQINDWRAKCLKMQSEHQQSYRIDSIEKRIDAPRLLRFLSDKLAPNDIVSCDVGQHQMWVAQHMQFSSPTSHLTSGGLGTMGFGLPAAIGAKLHQAAKNNDDTGQVVAVCGDGSFMMNMQELATLKRYGVPVKIMIMDNQRLGMVKQWQELFNEERYSETDLSDNPDFAAVAKAFGLTAEVLDESPDIPEKIDWLLSQTGPSLLHVKLNAEQNVWPIVPPNTANHHMLDNIMTKNKMVENSNEN